MPYIINSKYINKKKISYNMDGKKKRLQIWEVLTI